MKKNKLPKALLKPSNPPTSSLLNSKPLPSFLNSETDPKKIES